VTTGSPEEHGGLSKTISRRKSAPYLYSIQIPRNHLK
jgi:hypothetical protein